MTTQFGFFALLPLYNYGRENIKYILKLSRIFKEHLMILHLVFYELLKKLLKVMSE